MIEARIIADSVAPCGKRITTFVLKYPRFIHSEFMTHRVFSRNAASSRAIPIQKMIDRVVDEPAMPVHWGANQKGMQAAEPLSENATAEARRWWLLARDQAVASVMELSRLNLHKQIANRLLEPWMHMETIATATELGNFFNLRVHKAAQPEFQALAKAMLIAYEASTPAQKASGEWHLPFSDKYLAEGLSHSDLRKICVARCARVSYANFEGDFDHVKDYKLHDDLAAAGHWSPFEHAAYALPYDARSGNFVGWWQYRKDFITENQTAFRPTDLLARVGV